MKQSNMQPLGGKELVDAIIASAEEKLAENILVLDLNGLSGTADWFVICESETTIQNRAIHDHIVEDLKIKGTRPWLSEGENEGRWILIDYSDVVVHIMLPELREYYDLESLWSRKPKKEEGT